MLRLSIAGAGTSQLLLRVVNLLAQRGLVPSRLEARIDDAGARIVVDVDAIPGLASEALVERLAVLVEIEDVTAIWT